MMHGVGGGNRKFGVNYRASAGILNDAVMCANVQEIAFVDLFGISVGAGKRNDRIQREHQI